MFPFTLEAAHEAPFVDDMSPEWFDPNGLFNAKFSFGGDFLEGFTQFNAEVSETASLFMDPIQFDPMPLPMNEETFINTFLVDEEPSNLPSMISVPIMMPSSPTLGESIMAKVETYQPSPLEMRSEKTAQPRLKRKQSDAFLEDSITKRTKGKYMEPFPAHRVVHWKYVLYNLLVENYNSKDRNTLVIPCEVTVKGKLVKGFSLNQALDPKKRLAELYSLYVRKEDLASEDYSNPFIQDLYKYYLRCALQLMNKFFIKAGPWTYLYDEVILFIAEENLASAEMRLRFLEGKKKRKGSLD